ncbi:cold-shock protein [Aminobacter sp. Y103A]|nr:cold-shock protein [Aminobacter sp. SS-2016]
MATGTVKWFNSTKGFGLIQPDDGGQDVFAHTPAVERAGLSNLVDGQKIKYEIEQDRRSGKSSAGSLSKGRLIFSSDPQSAKDKSSRMYHRHSRGVSRRTLFYETILMRHANGESRTLSPQTPSARKSAPVTALGVSQSWEKLLPDYNCNLISV